LTKSPKLHFLDSGLLAAMRGISAKDIERDRGTFGTLLETFAYSETRKIAGWSERRPSISHFRDREGLEVDIVLEGPDGNLAAIEVKAAASVSGKDFLALRKLAGILADRFIQGVVLYDGDQVVPFGDKLYAVPISSLWSGD
jgi:hypothetical protein